MPNHLAARECAKWAFDNIRTKLVTVGGKRIKTVDQSSSRVKEANFLEFLKSDEGKFEQEYWNPNGAAATDNGQLGKGFHRACENLNKWLSGHGNCKSKFFFLSLSSSINTNRSRSRCVDRPLYHKARHSDPKQERHSSRCTRS